MKAVLERIKNYVSGHRTVTIIAGVGLILLIALGVVIATDAYPIMFVNGHPVSADRYIQNYQAIKTFYARMQEEASRATSTPDITIPPDDQIRADVLDGLVAEELTIRAAKQELGGEYGRLVNEKVAQYDSDTSLRDGVAQLYGITYEEFREEVLVPQAVQDALSARLYLVGKNIDTWLSDARKSARVTILSSRFSWDGEHVVAAH
jgi:hypothetical protein